MPLKPTNDFLFKKLFGNEKNKNLLIDLLEAILPNLKIKTVEIHSDVNLEKKLLTDKLGILDVIATLNDNTKVNIEMQVKNYNNTVERSLFYGASLYHESLKSGEDYSEIPYVISIWITDFNVFDDGPFHEISRLYRDFNNEILTDKLELHYIQLPKFKEKCKRISTKLEEWLTFIINENMEAIKMSDNENIKKAEEEFKYLTGDAEIRRLAYLREKAIRDEAAAISGATKRGIEQGRAEGRAESTLEIAKKLLSQNVSIDIIVNATGLTEEEVKNLQ